ncbi:MAG TPA: ATP-binding protein [bacterium]|nr:ATP-binding protein [bacterium]
MIANLEAANAGLSDACKESVSLNDCIHHPMIRTFLSRSIGSAVHLEPDPVPVRGPACHLQQVLYNLVANARDAIQGNGFVTIRTERVSLPEAKDDLPPGEYMKLAVQDDGCGMAKSVLPKIFDAGFSGKGSFGVGLYVIQEIVRSMEGHIRVRSSTRKPKGTIFSIYFNRIYL